MPPSPPARRMRTARRTAAPQPRPEVAGKGIGAGQTRTDHRRSDVPEKRSPQIARGGPKAAPSANQCPGPATPTLSTVTPGRSPLAGPEALRTSRPDRRFPATEDAPGLAVGFVVQHWELALERLATIRVPSSATLQSSPSAGGNEGTPRRFPSWLAMKGSDESTVRPTGPDHRSLPGFSIGNMGFFLYLMHPAVFRAGSLALAPSPRIGWANKGGCGREKEILMRRIRIAAASMVVAAGLVAAVAAPASAAGPPPGQGLVSFGTWNCDGLGPVELFGPRGDKAASGYIGWSARNFVLARRPRHLRRRTRRLLEDLWTEVGADAVYVHLRGRGRHDHTGRRFRSSAVAPSRDRVLLTQRIETAAG